MGGVGITQLVTLLPVTVRVIKNKKENWVILLAFFYFILDCNLITNVFVFKNGF